MKYLICPQCGISNLYLKDNYGNRLNIKVTRDKQIIPINQNDIPPEFNRGIVYCLGCSWKESIHQLVKYIL